MTYTYPVTSTGTTTNLPGWLILSPPWGSDGEGDPPPEGDDTGVEEPEGDSKPVDARTFSQDEVNAIVAREVSQKTRGKLDPKEAGFKSAAELRDFLEKMREKDEASKSEDEKAREQAIKDAQDSAKREVLDKANRRLLKAEFTMAASTAGVQYIEDAFEIAQKLDIWNPEIDDEKETVSGFDDNFFTQLKELKPYLFGDVKPKGLDIGAGAAGDGGASTKAQLREAELRKMYPVLDRKMTRADQAGLTK